MRGAKLEDVLESAPGLTPGDFVRAVKQLMDLLDQMAVAAAPSRHAEGGYADQALRDRDVAQTARAAIDAMRRGVVAYTTLTD